MIEELLIDVFYELRISNQIPRFHSVLINQGGDFFGGERDGEELHSGGEGRNELVLDAVALAEFVVIFEESFDSDLFFPDFSSDVGLDLVGGLGSVGGVDWVRGGVREVEPACLRIDVISVI